MASGSTIAAVATPPGRGGVAVIRVSGPDAFAVATRLTGWSPLSASAYPCCRTLAVRSPASFTPPSPPTSIPTSTSTPILDRALLLAFRAPHSYTGEDVVEFQCHGGMVTPSRVLAACFAAGATAARRGEFTERAFLNGKMDLSEAESVIELVDAKTVRAADDALARQAGVRKTAYRALYEKALTLSSELEHALDVDEEELPGDFLPARAAQAVALAAEARRLAGSAEAGRLLRDGALVVLAGAPNAGKSSLLNALCGEDRAIVSPTPGTTRDTIEAWIDLDGWPVRLVDTAGLRETGDAIEAEGVRRAESLLAKADVVVALDCEIDGALPIHAKCDLDNSGGPCSVAAASGGPRSCAAASGGPRSCAAASGGPRSVAAAVATERDPPRRTRLAVSAKTGEGLSELRAAIVARLAARAGVAAEDGATASERERALLLEAVRQLGFEQEGEGHEARDARGREGERREARDARGRETKDNKFHCPPPPLASTSTSTSTFSPDPVLLANAVRAAAETLGSLIGATYSSDLLDALFSRFCVGK